MNRKNRQGHNNDYTSNNDKRYGRYNDKINENDDDEQNSKHKPWQFRKESKESQSRHWEEQKKDHEIDIIRTNIKINRNTRIDNGINNNKNNKTRNDSSHNNKNYKTSNDSSFNSKISKTSNNSFTNNENNKTGNDNDSSHNTKNNTYDRNGKINNKKNDWNVRRNSLTNKKYPNFYNQTDENLMKPIIPKDNNTMQIKDSHNSLNEPHRNNHRNGQNNEIMFYPEIRNEPPKKYLIVIEINNNSLFHRINANSVSSITKIKPQYEFKENYYYLRPFLDFFLKELFTGIGYAKEHGDVLNDSEEEVGFEIAIWNVGKSKNIIEIPKLIFNNSPVNSANTKRDYLNSLHFHWTYDQCNGDSRFKEDFSNIFNSKKGVYKNNHYYPPVNEYNHWGLHNTIVIKAMNPKYFENEKGILYIPPYYVNNINADCSNDTTLLSVIKYLQKLYNQQPKDTSKYLIENPLYVFKKETYKIIQSYEIRDSKPWTGEGFPPKLRPSSPEIFRSIDVTTPNTEEQPYELFYKKIQSCPQKKYLIVLDINGTLLHRLKSKMIIEEGSRPPDFKIKGKCVFLRPYIDSFIYAIFNVIGHSPKDNHGGFEIASWTSAIPRNSNIMLHQILKLKKKEMLWLDEEEGNSTGTSEDNSSRKESEKENEDGYIDYWDHMYFTWTRDFCSHIPDTKFDTRKNLRKLWKSRKGVIKGNIYYPAVNKYEHWNEKNTIIIDDSPYKVDNNKYNAIHVPTYEIENENSNTETVFLSLIKYLEALYKNSPDNVQEYIKNEPFTKIEYNEEIEKDSGLSVQRKIDKLKKEVKITIEKKWKINQENDITKYTYGYPILREPR